MAVIRWYDDLDNGRFKVNANYEPDNSNDNIGSFPANNSGCPGCHCILCPKYPPPNLFQKAYELVRWVYPTVNKFPRKQRLILSQRVEVTAIRILELVIDFRETPSAVGRKKILHEAQKLQVLLRLCKDLSYLPFSSYEFASKLLAEISSILERHEEAGNGKSLQGFIR